MLMRTKTKLDIEINAEKILGNAYGDKKTVSAFRKLAKLRVERFQK